MHPMRALRAGGRHAPAPPLRPGRPLAAWRRFRAARGPALLAAPDWAPARARRSLRGRAPTVPWPPASGGGPGGPRAILHNERRMRAQGTVPARAVFMGRLGIGQIWPKSTKRGRTSAICGQKGSMFGRNLPKLVEHASVLVELGPKSVVTR